MDDNINWTPGEILWQDLTVENALEVRDFYRAVVGWDYIPEDMGGYDDYHMLVMPTGGSVAGVCHARGDNADLPPVWLIYIAVDDVEKSVQACLEKGGELLVEPRDMADGHFCVIRAPAGAICGLYRPPD